jgi:hypothetical protein
MHIGYSGWVIRGPHRRLVQAAGLLPQIQLKKSTPSRVNLVLEGTMVNVRWESEVEVGFGHPWPDPGGCHLHPDGAGLDAGN